MNCRLRSLIVLPAALLVASCATENVAEDISGGNPVWPPSPQSPRIAFVGEFQHASDLGIRPSLLQRIVRISAGRANTSMVRPMAVAATSDGQVIFVGDPDAGCVHRYDRAKGQYLCLRTDDDTPALHPVGLTVVDDEWLIVADSLEGSLYRSRIRDKALQQFPLSENLEQPTGVFWNAKTRRLFVTDTARQSVLEFDASGSLKRRIGERGGGPGMFNFPTYAWADETNQLLVSDSLNCRVQRFDEDGRFLYEFGGNGDRPGDFSRPKGIATDGSGHTYVIDALMHSMQIFDREGELLLVVGQQGQGKGEFWLPNGIFITQDDTIYVADSYNKRVQVFRYVGRGT